MHVPNQLVYLVASLVLSPLWAYCFYRRRDLRLEMVTMSVLVGTLSVLTSYY